jgi:hypothetical protein
LDAISDAKNPAQPSTPTFPRWARLTAEKWRRVLAGLRRLPRDRRCLLRRVEPAHRRARPPPLPVRPTLDQERPFIGPQILAGIPRVRSVDTRNPAPRTIPRQLAGMSPADLGRKELLNLDPGVDPGCFGPSGRSRPTVLPSAPAAPRSARVRPPQRAVLAGGRSGAGSQRAGRVAPPPRPAGRRNPASTTPTPTTSWPA